MIYSPVREHGYIEFTPEAMAKGWQADRARGKRFTVDWLVASAEPSPEFHIAEEAILIVADIGCRILASDEEVVVPEGSACLLPEGAFSLIAPQGTALVLIQSCTGGEPVGARNDVQYSSGDDGHIALAPAAKRDGGVRVIRAAEIRAPADKPRLKILRSATMSISWIEYTGLRDRSKLSPHSHTDFEQGSLAIHGDFVHHLRTPWGPDATAWRKDVHQNAAPRSLCVIPPQMLHTTEGLSEGRHLLIDIFAPARTDFLEKGWVSNAGDYQDIDFARTSVRLKTDVK